MNLRQIVKFLLLAALTLVAGFALYTGSQYIEHQATVASLAQASNNMGDQIAIRNSVRLWRILRYITEIFGITLIVGLWAMAYRKQLRSLMNMAMVVVALFAMSGCVRPHTVIVTPPNYAVVIDMNAPTNQATGNNFAEGKLVEVTQVDITMKACAANSVDRCPNKIVAQIEGAPKSRIYSASTNSGTGSQNQALCFEAKGVNGCVDFSVSAKVMKEDAGCYANLMGVHPDPAGGDKARFSFFATSLEDALDSRILQIAGAEFNKVTVNAEPISLAYDKFALFETVRENIITEVHKRTCVTVTDMAINNGIVWDSSGIQDVIDRNTINRANLELAVMENRVAAIEATGIISRTQMFADQFGLDAALRLVAIQEWDGSGLPNWTWNSTTTPLPVQGPAAPPTQ